MELSPIKPFVEDLSYSQHLFANLAICLHDVCTICLSLNNVRITADKNNGQQ